MHRTVTSDGSSVLRDPFYLDVRSLPGRGRGTVVGPEKTPTRRRGRCREGSYGRGKVTDPCTYHPGDRNHAARGAA